MFNQNKVQKWATADVVSVLSLSTWLSPPMAKKGAPAEADALFRLKARRQLTVMTGHVGRVVFRAPIAVRIFSYFG